MNIIFASKRLHKCALIIPLALAWFPLMASAPGDIQFERQDESALQSFPPSVFQHWKHRILYRCDACHDDIFEMKAGATTITMDSMGDGENCGACHNDVVAFGVGFGNCARCHRASEE